MSGLDLVGCVLAVLALGGKIAHELDTLTQKYHDAPDTFQTFVRNFQITRDNLQNVKQILKEFDINSSTNENDFEGQVKRAVWAVEATMKTIEVKLGSICPTHRSSRWKMWEKAIVVWDEGIILTWDRTLSQQMTSLTNLMASQEQYRLRKKEQHNRRLPGVPTQAPFKQETEESLPVDQSAVEDEELARDEKGETLLKKLDIVNQARKELNERAGMIVEGHPHMKLRILLMGKQGGGKTTLCNKVLGIKPEESDDHLLGKSTAFDNVNKGQTFKARNPDLILHDAGGFENGSNEGAEAIRAFLQENYHGISDAEKRIHCVWYCIACDSSKPVHPIDERFLNDEFGIANLPVFIILTKYDNIVSKVRNSIPNATEAEVETRAFRAFSEYALKPLTEAIKRAKTEFGMRVTLCASGIPETGPEFVGRNYRPPEFRNFGSGKLVELMRHQLETTLVPLLNAIQIVDPRSKLADSVTSCISLYWRALVAGSVPIIPLVTISSLGYAYVLTIKKSQNWWRFETTEGIRISSLDDHLRNTMIQAIFDIRAITGIRFLTTLRTADVIGPLSNSKLARDLLKIIVGVNVIFYELWMDQHQAGMECGPLSMDQIRRVCSNFQMSEGRVKMTKEIEKINLINYLSRKMTGETAKNAWVLAIGGSVEPSRLTERQKKDYSAQWDALNPVSIQS